MARLLSWPIGLGLSEFEWLSGPQTVGATTSSSIEEFIQTTASPFGLLKFRATFRSMQENMERRHRGLMVALHGGANAVRARWRYGATLSHAEAGVPAEVGNIRWGNGERWSNGRGWRTDLPDVAVAAGAGVDGTIISLAGDFWGHSLNIGDVIGFWPLHLGWYFVTEVLELGTYRIWPRLRKAISADDFATLRPTMAVRLAGPDGFSMARSPALVDGATATFIEVLDADVRAYFAD